MKPNLKHLFVLVGLVTLLLSIPAIVKSQDGTWNASYGNQLSTEMQNAYYAFLQFVDQGQADTPAGQQAFAAYDSARIGFCDYVAAGPMIDEADEETRKAWEEYQLKRAQGRTDEVGEAGGEAGNVSISDLMGNVEDPLDSTYGAFCLTTPPPGYEQGVQISVGAALDAGTAQAILPSANEISVEASDFAEFVMPDEGAGFGALPVFRSSSQGTVVDLMVFASADDAGRFTNQTFSAYQSMGSPATWTDLGDESFARQGEVLVRVDRHILWALGGMSPDQLRPSVGRLQTFAGGAPTTVDMGFIELQVQPAQAGLWALVQWEDGPGNWHNVDGWWSELQAGVQVWEVFPPQFGQGPFRWVVYGGPGGPVLGTSDALYLPRSAGETIRVEVNLAAATAKMPPALPPTGTPTPTTVDMGFIELRVQPAQPGLWALVQWQDGSENWHNVDGWWSALQGGAQVWEVFPAQFGQGPFRWVVYGGPGGPVLGTSDAFYLPSSVGETMRVEVNLVMPPGVSEPEGKFGKVWHEDGTIPQKLGWALEYERSPKMARQEFEQGKMLYVGDEKRIYVLRSGDRWWGFDDTWDLSLPEEDPSLVPPPGLFQPRSGFGKVWREQLRGTSLDPGWATGSEQGYTGAAMRFERGIMLWTDERLIYVLADDGTWKVAPDTF